jgi:hypothetical protein
MEATMIHVWGLWNSGNNMVDCISSTEYIQGKQYILSLKIYLAQPYIDYDTMKDY